jgi:hypothetical protein
VRKPGDDYEQTFRFHDDDPFFSEISNFIDIIEDIEEEPEASAILSSYEGKLAIRVEDTAVLILQSVDAVRTYELTWAIRTASERSRDAQKAAAEAKAAAAA